jgi:ribokinase
VGCIAIQRLELAAVAASPGAAVTVSGTSVLVAGAINTDLVARVQRAPEAGETVTGTSFAVYGGGKGANQALACARSGAATVMLGALGNDAFGRERFADLEAEGIDVGSVSLKEDVSSGVALITVEESGQNRIAYVPGATLSITPAEAEGAYKRVRPGVILSTLELPPESLRALFTAGGVDGARVVLNATPEPAAGRDLVRIADVLIVNETEARELLFGPESGDWLALCDELRELGPSEVIITLGGDGAVASLGGGRYRLAAPAVDVVDTTGAGDAFCGAFVARLAERGDAAEALRAGIAAGSLAVTVEGAQRSMPRRNEVERMMARVEIEAVR